MAGQPSRMPGLQHTLVPFYRAFAVRAGSRLNGRRQRIVKRKMLDVEQLKDLPPCNSYPVGDCRKNLHGLVFLFFQFKNTGGFRVSLNVPDTFYTNNFLALRETLSISEQTAAIAATFERLCRKLVAQTLHLQHLILKLLVPRENSLFTYKIGSTPSRLGNIVKQFSNALQTILTWLRCT